MPLDEYVDTFTFTRFSRPTRCRQQLHRYATSILDYMFPELAGLLSKRFDLAHVDPSERLDALGTASAKENPPATPATCRRTDPLARDRLKIMSGGADHGEAPSSLDAQGVGSNVTALSSHAPRAEIAGSTALKSEPEQKLSPAQALEQLQWTKADARAAAAEKRAEAKARGYEGEACGECGNFTLVRNGTCMKCRMRADQRRGVLRSG